jgi:NH3-dependent NAD+ synthetase
LKLPGIDAGRAKKAMITFVQEQRDIRGRANAVLELSGEINSITAATISVEALGTGHVTLCFFMDGEAGNQTRRDHARLVASRLGKELEIKDLRPILQTVYAGETAVDPSRRMIRMAVEKQAWLLDMAEMQKAFLVQSLNKTERLLGIGAPSLEDARILSPLADVYQSQVYELAKACSIPAAVVDPTREFVQAAELGMKTQEIDGWLYQMLDVKVSLAKLMELGAEEPKLKKIYQQLKLAAQNKQRVGWDAMIGFYQPRPWNLQGR